GAPAAAVDREAFDVDGRYDLANRTSGRIVVQVEHQAVVTIAEIGDAIDDREVGQFERVVTGTGRDRHTAVASHEATVVLDVEARNRPVDVGQADHGGARTAGHGSRIVELGE